MINCNTCGKSIPNDSEFCPFCGNKIMHTPDERTESSEQLHSYQPSALLTRAFLFIEEESFDKADNYLEAVLNQEPENAQAYLGKLMVELRVKCKTDLINCDVPFDGNKNYNKLVRFADKMLVDELAGYIAAIKDRNAAQAEAKNKESLYLEAVEGYNSYDIARIQNAIKAFSFLAGYKDSENFIKLCKSRIEQVRIKEENDRIKAAQVAKRNKKILIFATPVVIVLLAFIIVLNVVIIPNGRYNDALALMNAGKYEEAIAAFEDLDGYKDSEDKISECETFILENKYQSAISLLNEEKYTQALSAFESLGGYKDSAAKASTCRTLILEDKYQAALSLLNAKKYSEAISAFADLNGYKDSKNKISECETLILEDKYQAALSLLNEEKYNEAISAFEALDGYKDSEDKVVECEMLILEKKYQVALSLYNAGNYSDAITAFEELNAYKDSVSRITMCENAIIQNYESKYDLSEYVEVTIAELWNAPTTYSGKKVKIVGYVGCYELDNCFDAYLVKEKDIAKMDTDPNNTLETYNYWLDTLKWLHQYIGFRIPLSNYMQQAPAITNPLNAGSKVVLYGTFTYNSSYVDEGKRTNNAPHGYDILVDNFLSVH